MVVDIPLWWVSGFALSLARAGAWVALSPPFSSLVVPARVRAGVAVSLALVSAPKLTAPSGTGAFVVAVIEQVAIGAVLGAVVWAVMSAIGAAGDLIDVAAGLSAAQSLDPLSLKVVGPIGRFFQLIATALLFASGGHLLVVQGFLRLGDVRFDSGRAAQAALEALGVLIVSAVEISLPVMGSLLLAEVALGLLGKAAPQMNIFLLGFAVKAVVSLALLGVSVSLLPQAHDALLVKALRLSFGGWV